MCDCARACVCVSDSFRPPVKQNPTLDCFHLCVLPSGLRRQSAFRRRQLNCAEESGGRRGRRGVGGGRWGVVTHPTCNSACRVERTEKTRDLPLRQEERCCLQTDVTCNFSFKGRRTTWSRHGPDRTVNMHKQLPVRFPSPVDCPVWNRTLHRLQ